MSQWVDFLEIQNQVGIEPLLAAYGLQLKRVGRHSLHSRCPLPTHGSTRSQQSFGVDTAKNVWACHSDSCCRAGGGQVGGHVLDLVAGLEGCSIREAALRLQTRCGWASARSLQEQLVQKTERATAAWGKRWRQCVFRYA